MSKVRDLCSSLAGTVAALPPPVATMLLLIDEPRSREMTRALCECVAALAHDRSTCCLAKLESASVEDRLAVIELIEYVLMRDLTDAIRRTMLMWVHPHLQRPDRTRVADRSSHQLPPHIHPGNA